MSLSRKYRNSRLASSRNQRCRGECAFASIAARGAGNRCRLCKYLLAQAKLESSLDPSAKALHGSSASRTLPVHHPEHGCSTLDRHGARTWPRLGRRRHDQRRHGVTDPSPMRSHNCMSLRYDAQIASSLMAAELASDNRDGPEWCDTWPRSPIMSELYSRAFPGYRSGARQVPDSALENDPSDKALPALMPAMPRQRTVQHLLSTSGGAPRQRWRVSWNLIRARKVSRGDATAPVPMP